MPPILYDYDLVSKMTLLRIAFVVLFWSVFIPAKMRAQSASPLQLTLQVCQASFVNGEPIVAYLTLENTGSTDRRFPPIRLGVGYLRIDILGEKGNNLEYKGPFSSVMILGNEPYLLLAPGESEGMVVNIPQYYRNVSQSKFGTNILPFWSCLRSGKYTIKAELYLSSEMTEKLLSNEVGIEITDPV